MTEGYRVLVSTSSFGTTGQRPLELLEAAGAEVILNPYGRKLQPEETRELLRGVHGLVAGTELLSREILGTTEDLRVISRCGTGMDNVDLEAATELGIAVRNTPDAHVEGVAELTLAGILDLLRELSAADRDLRAGRWAKPMGSLLKAKTVGIVGLGRTGKRLAELLEPFGVTLLATDPHEDPVFAARREVRYSSLRELLAGSDIVTLHASRPPGEGPLLDASGLGAMKQGALLVNCARGGLVDETALVSLLESGHLGGAYLDVFAEEPYQGPLTDLRNVLLSPHIGSYAAECRLTMETQAVENLLPYLDKEVS